jgi:hypothetical protein
MNKILNGSPVEASLLFPLVLPWNEYYPPTASGLHITSVLLPFSNSPICIDEEFLEAKKFMYYSTEPLTL